MVLHPLADDRRVLPIERTGELLAAPPEFMLVISVQPRLPEPAQGPEAQHAPALHRAHLWTTRTPAVERAILEREGRVHTLRSPPRLVQLAQALRRLTDHDLEETASTRLLVMAARLVASAAFPCGTPAGPPWSMR